MGDDIGELFGGGIKSSALGPLALLPLLANTGILGDGFSEQLSEMPFVGGFVTDPREEKLKRDMLRAAQQYEAYRPVARGASINAMNQTLGRYGPAQQMLASMYGPQVRQPLTVQDPFGGYPPPNIISGENLAKPQGAG